MDPSYGGPCQGIRNIIPELEKRGIHNEVVSLDNPRAAFLGKDSFIIHALGPAKTPYNYSSGLGPWLYENFERFDIVIIHGLWQYTSFGTYKCWSRYKKKKAAKSPRLYVMPHGMLDPYFQRASDRRLKALRNSIFWKLFEKNVINQSDGVLFTCKQELLLARTTFGGYMPKSEINIGYGIPTPPPPENLSIATDSGIGSGKHPYFLFLSRIHPKKGVDILIGSYLKLQDKHGTRNIPDLVIAGPGMDSIFGKQLRDRVKDNGQIHFAGMLQGNAKWGALYGCQAFLLPSHQENFGIAIVEAMSCAKPVLITKSVNIWSEIAEGNAGLTSVDTEDDFSSIWEKWLLMPDNDKASYAHNSFDVYEKNFSIQSSTERFITSLNI